MANVFAGEVEFTTPRPFEARSARVKLQFTIEPGEDADAVVATVGTAARAYAYGMINDTTDPAPAAVETVQQVIPPLARGRRPKTVEAMPADPFAVPSQKELVPSTEPASTVSGAAFAPDPFAAGGAAPSTPASVAASATVSNNPSPTPGVEITNVVLQEAIRAKLATDAAYTTQVVELIQKFTGDPLAKIYTIEDQAKRADFLVQLKAL